jgi:glycogen debranching enzyme
MADKTIFEQAREKAEQVLISNGSELGILGSSQAYQQVWARDSMIAGFGLWLCARPEGHAIHRRSLETLRHFQSPLGKIPHNVGRANVSDPALVAVGGHLDTGRQDQRLVPDTSHAGCVDNNLWYILGHYFEYVCGQDAAYLREVWPSLEKALLWLRYQDVNECGLLEAHEAMDWADLFSNRYNVLSDNVLYYAAWKAMGHLAAALGQAAEAYFETAADIRQKINTLLWVGPEEPKDWDRLRHERQEWLYPLKRVETELVTRPFYLPYMAFRDYADRFDTFGNLLAILLGVADELKASLILDYIHGCGLNEPFPIQAVYPVLHPGDRDWRDYFRVRNLNQPHHYHNGGAWPFLGGFYVAALVQADRLEEAQAQLACLVEMNRRGVHDEWEFNEWFHGLSGRPMGYAGQSWSAAMCLYALDAVEQARTHVFDAWGPT